MTTATTKRKVIDLYQENVALVCDCLEEVFRQYQIISPAMDSVFVDRKMITSDIDKEMVLRGYSFQESNEHESIWLMSLSSNEK